MASSVWKGHLTFGLVSVPVKLVRAARAEKISFRQLHKGTGMRVQQRLMVHEPAGESEEALTEIPEVESDLREAKTPIQDSEVESREAEAASCSHTGDAPLTPTVPLGGWTTREISRNEIIKGFEYEKERYATLTNEELKALQAKTSRNMEIVEFVNLVDVDPIYFETSYYLIPESAGERSYALLFQSLRLSGLVALAQMAMHNREHMVIIRPGRHGLILHTMFYENEIRRLDEFHAETNGVNQKELDLALLLIRALEGPFAPEKYHDTYRAKLEDLIQTKISGKQVVDARSTVTATPVVDILEALKKSLEETATRKLPRAEEAKSEQRAARPRQGKKQA